MKITKLILRVVQICVLSIFLSTAFSCKGLFNTELDPLLIYDDNQPLRPVIEDSPFYSPNIIGAKAGFGYNSANDINTTSFCVGGEYLRRISADREGGASYLGLGATYHYESADEFKLNMFRAEPKYTYFDRITPTGNVDLTYGLSAFYETGSVENFGFKDDVWGWGAQAIIGANYNINEDLTVAVEVPIAGFSEQTFESNGMEFTRDNTFIGLNKNNTVTGIVRFRF